MLLLALGSSNDINYNINTGPSVNDTLIQIITIALQTSCGSNGADAHNYSFKMIRQLHVYIWNVCVSIHKPMVPTDPSFISMQ